MAKERLNRCAEGLVVTALGLGALLLSLTIGDNPVAVGGAAAWLSQARALPVLLSAAILILGALHTAALWRGRTPPAASPAGSRGWAVLLTLLAVAYLLLIPLLGFWGPTLAYLAVTLLLCGRKEGRSPLFLLALALLYAFLALWAIPRLLGLRLM